MNEGNAIHSGLLDRPPSRAGTEARLIPQDDIGREFPDHGLVSRKGLYGLAVDGDALDGRRQGRPNDDLASPDIQMPISPGPRIRAV